MRLYTISTKDDMAEVSFVLPYSRQVKINVGTTSELGTTYVEIKMDGAAVLVKEQLDDMIETLTEIRGTI